MKHILNTLLAVACVALIGCEDTPFLNVNTESGMDESIIFSKVETTEGQIASIYHTMGETNSYRNNLTNNMGVNTDIELQSGSTDSDAPTADNRRSIAIYMQTAGMPLSVATMPLWVSKHMAIHNPALTWEPSMPRLSRCVHSSTLTL